MWTKVKTLAMVKQLARRPGTRCPLLSIAHPQTQMGMHVMLQITMWWLLTKVIAAGECAMTKQVSNSLGAATMKRKSARMMKELHIKCLRPRTVTAQPAQPGTRVSVAKRSAPTGLCWTV